MSMFVRGDRDRSARARLGACVACVALASCADEDARGRPSGRDVPDGGSAQASADACSGACTNTSTSTKVCDRDLVNIATDPYNCGDCGVTCKPTESCRGGSCACDFATCGGDCVDTSTDSKHCGGCDKACDFACANATCVPRVLALAAKTPAYLAVDDTNVYWLESSMFCPYDLRKCAKSGSGGASTLASPACSSTNLVVGGGNVFLADYDALKICNGSSGCNNAPVVFAGSQSPRALAIDASYVYWSNLANHQILRCPIGGPCSSPSLVAQTNGTGVPEWRVAVDAANVYWVEYNGSQYQIVTRALSGGPNTVLVPGDFPETMAAVSGRLYYPTDGIRTCAATGCGASSSTYFTAANTMFGNVTSDGTDVYWTESPAGRPPISIKRCALGATCSAPAVVVSNLRQSVGALAVDSKNVYWIEAMAIKSFKKK